MKRSKRIYILLGVLAVICVATLVVFRWEERKEEIKNSDEIILELPPDSVQVLSWEYESETLAFHKNEGTWLYDEDEAFPVDADKMLAILEHFEEFGVSFIIENVEDYGQYGLDEPLCTVHLETEDQVYDIQLGNYSSMDSKRYVSIGDGNVYLVNEDPLDLFDAELSDLIDHDETPKFEKTTGIQFAGTENYSIFYEEESTNTYCAEDVYFTQQEEETLPLDTSLVNGYLSDIRYLSLKDYVTYHATEEELQSYGLDSPELTVTVDHIVTDEEGEESAETFVLHISRDPEEAAEAASQEAEESEAAEESEESAEEEEITAYARVGESQIVYQITADEYRSLMAASYHDLRHKEVLPASSSDILSLDISLEDRSYNITIGEEDGERTYTYQEQNVEGEELEQALLALKVSSFTEETPTEKAEIRLTVSLDNENYPQVSIDLYRYDGTYCLAVVDGETLGLVERSYVVDLMEAVNSIVLNK